MAIVELKLDIKNSAYLAANPTLVLALNEPIFLNDGRYAFGDGSTQLQNITWFGSVSSPQTYVSSGGVITVETIDGTGTLNDIRVTATTYSISGQGSFSASETTFLNISLSSAGTQRYIGLYGTTSNTVTKVEGSEAALASYPSTPANTCLIGYVLVTDGAISTTPDLSGYLLRSDKATASDIITGTNDTNYITPLALRSAGPTITTIASSSTPTPVVTVDITNTDVLQITALAASATFAAPSGTATNHKNLIIRIKDNGTARTLSFNSVYRASTDLALPTTTVINKTMYLGFRYNSADSKWDLLAKLDNI